MGSTPGEKVISTVSPSAVAKGVEAAFARSPATASGRRFRDEMGVLNVRAAEACDDVLWCVAGRVVRL